MKLFAIRNNKQRDELVDIIKNYRLPFKGVLQDIYPDRSVDFNAYYWGVLLKILSDELDHTPKELSEFFFNEIEFRPKTGLVQTIRKLFGKSVGISAEIKPKVKSPTPEEIHAFFKGTFLLEYRPDKKGIWSLRVVSTTELDQVEYMNYCLRIRGYAQVHWGISLPLPNEVIVNE